MKTKVTKIIALGSLLAAFVVVALLTVAAKEEDSLAKFKGGIGVIPVSSGVAVAPTLGTAQTVESVNRNIVRGVQPAGQIWMIRDLRADVQVSGHISVNGHGLLLAGGNNIGFNANASVLASLICGAAAPFSIHSTNAAGVPLEPNGDFRINDVLTTTPPNPCVNPVLLIRSAGNQSWFAAGILDFGEVDDD